MTWNDIIDRLKSPIVIWQIISILGGAVALAWPGLEPGWKILSGVLVAIWNVVAGLNNPTNKTGW